MRNFFLFLLIAAALPALAGCLKPTSATPMAEPFGELVVIQSPSIADYPMSAAVEHERRAIFLTDEANRMSQKIDEIVLEVETYHNKVAELGDSVMLDPMSREALQRFYTGKAGEVQESLLDAMDFRGTLAHDSGYEVTDASNEEQRALDVLRGRVPLNDR
jgi:hypothetical protein